MRTCALFLIAGIAMGTGGPPDTPANKELKQLQGTWKAVSLEENGEKAPEAMLKQMTLTFEKDKFTFFAGDVVLMQGTVKLLPNAKPKALDLISMAGRLKDQTGEGIYELDGDTFKMCLATPGNTRPTEFKSGKEQPLAVYKRAKH